MRLIKRLHIMLNLRKNLREMGLWLGMRKRSANPYEFSPKNVLMRVRNQVPHPKYIAQALLNRLRSTWNEKMLAAARLGDVQTTDQYTEKLRTSYIVPLDTLEQVRKQFGTDPDW